MPEEGDGVGGACVERHVQHQRIKQDFVLLRLSFFVEELEGERGGVGGGRESWECGRRTRAFERDSCNSCNSVMQAAY